MHESFLELMADLKQMYREGKEDSAEEQELWNQAQLYLGMMDDDEKAKVVIATLVMWGVFPDAS